MDLRIVYFGEECCEGFGGGHTESVHCFQLDVHFHNVEFNNPRALGSLPIFQGLPRFLSSEV